MSNDDSPAVVGRYTRATGAPSGLRAVLKLGELTRAIETVDEWRRAEAELELRRTQLVRDLRRRGASWGSVGWLLGVTGQAVRKRYGRDEP